MAARVGGAGCRTRLIDASPPPGTGLAQAPAEVVIRFIEPLNRSLSSIDVIDERGNDVGDGPTLPVEGDRQAMRRRLGLLEPGRYSVRWTSVSPLDGHTLRGSYAFGVGTSTLGDEVVRSNPLDSDGPLGLAGRSMLLAGLVLWGGAAAVGSVGARTGAAPARLRALHRAGTVAAAIGSVAVAVSSALVASGSVSDVGIVLTDSQSGRFRLAVLVLASVAAMLPRSWRWPDRLLVAGAVLAEAASGHAASSPAPLVATVVLGAHVAAVGTWVFAIASSLLAGRRLLEMLAAYFPYAAAAAGVVALTGTAAATLELASPSDLVDTGYGQALAVKAVLLLIMAALGVAHHRRRTRPAAELAPVRRRAMTELSAAALAIVVATALVAFPNPPREVPEPSSTARRAARSAISRAGRRCRSPSPTARSSSAYRSARRSQVASWSASMSSAPSRATGSARRRCGRRRRNTRP
ncbi:MAG: copper resistance protein CopC [Acidimicrobiales bacterium]